MAGASNPPSGTDRFLGDWFIAEQSGWEYDDLEIRRVSEPEGSFELVHKSAGNKTYPLQYDKEAGVLFSDLFEIAVWRKRGYDTIVATGRGSASAQAVWTARQRRKIPATPPKLDEKWKITMSSAIGDGPLPVHYISLRRQAGTALDLHELCLIEGDRHVLYDVVRYDEELDAFSSIFGLRFIKHSKKRGVKDLFATFEKVTAGYDLKVPGFVAEGTSIGKLMPFEMESSPGQVLASDIDIQQDPDAGCWCAEPDAR